MAKDIHSDIKSMNFEQALQELEQIVRALEEGETSLDGAIDSYERGALLKRHCEEKLAQAKSRVEKISVGPDGSISADPADIG